MIKLFLLAFAFSFSSQAQVLEYDFEKRNEVSCSLLPALASGKTLLTDTKSMQLTASKSELQFSRIIKSFEKIYGNVLQKFDRKIKFVTDWSSDFLDAYTQPISDEDKTIQIFVLGGLYRHPKLTADGFRAVLCHEIGHHLGGSPTHLMSGQISAEAQADYYASQICMPLMLQSDNNALFMKSHGIPLQMKLNCDLQFGKNSKRSLICQRTILATISLGNTMVDALDYEQSFSILASDKLVVTETNRSYPSIQCRVDTLKAGALCNNSVSKLYKTGGANNCSLLRFTESDGARPQCWFRN